jgi:hypothetical protein
MGMMGRAIEQSRGQLPIADTLTHSEKARLVCDDRGAPLVALGQEIEEQLATGALEWHQA